MRNRGILENLSLFLLRTGMVRLPVLCRAECGVMRMPKLRCGNGGWARKTLCKGLSRFRGRTGGGAREVRGIIALPQKQKTVMYSLRVRELGCGAWPPRWESRHFRVTVLAGDVASITGKRVGKEEAYAWVCKTAACVRAPYYQTGQAAVHPVSCFERQGPGPSVTRV